MIMKRSHEIDMTSGPIFTKLMMFVLPLMASSVLQLLFNAADVIIVGKFAGSLALAAVGSNGSLISLLVNVFIGISTGANVLVARLYGSHDQEELSRCVHCSMMLSCILGIFVAIFGFLAATPILSAMSTDPKVLPLSSLYLRIYFIGVPAALVYNFGAAILRAVGDTERPLQFLFVAGVVNVVLNLILVVVFHMSVAGVAIATAVSQYVSAFLVVRCLVRSDSVYQLRLRDLRIHKDILIRILQIGAPAGLQSSLFSISNVLIQSSINSFGYVCMAANSAAGNLDGFVYVATNSLYHAGLSFISQNYGARQYPRIRRIVTIGIATSFVLGTVLGFLLYAFGPQLLNLYVSNTDPDRDAIFATGMLRLKYIGLFYGICGIMDTLNGMLRGMGHSWSTLIASVLGICGFRILWVYTIFATHHTLEILYLSYLLSWVLTGGAQAIIMFLALRKLPKSVPTT